MGRDELAAAQRLQALELERAGRPGEAVAAYEEALRLQPADVLTRVRLGVALRSAGRDEEARRAFETALHLQGPGAG